MPPVPSPKSQSQVTQDFWNWQQNNVLRGFSGLEGNNAWFVPENLLREYLSRDKIFELLKAEYGPTNIYSLEKLAKDIVNIDSECFRVFAILVLIDCVPAIKEFTPKRGWHDVNLPFLNGTGFPAGPEVYDRFRKIQHRFCVTPRRNMTFTAPAEEILPIESLEKRGSGSSGQVYKLKLHPGFNWVTSEASTSDGLADQSHPELAIKMFKPQDRGIFLREVDAFEELGSLPNLIQYYGNFSIEGDRGSHNIVLEYADCGTLEDFWCKNAQGCTSALSFWYFWERFLEVAKPINRLHFGRPRTADEERQTPRGFHHDIRPCNILVTSDAASRRHPDDWPYRFKLGDLGLVDLVEANGRIATSEDPRVPPIYSAPERSREEWQDNWPSTVLQANDVWSFGCVMSEAFSWSAIGYPALTAYREARDQSAPGLGALFHDNSEVLPIVLQYHKRYAKASRNGDRLADEIDRLLHTLLDHESSRLTTTQLVRQAQFILIKSKAPEISTKFEIGRENLKSGQMVLAGNQRPINGFVLPPRANTLPSDGYTTHPADNLPQNMGPQPNELRQSSMDTTTVSTRNSAAPAPVSTGGEGLQVPEGAKTPPRISVKQLREWRESIDRKMPKALPELDYLRQLNGRDIVFVIDDSETMKDHWKDVKDLLGLLAYAVKTYDKSGLDYVFLSDGEFYNEKDSTPIVEHAQRHAASCTTATNANLGLQTIFQRYVTSYLTGKPVQVHKRAMRRFSSLFDAKEPEEPKQIVYIVLTDAVWYPYPQCRASDPILWLLRALGQAAWNHQVGISFIQFGNDNTGTRRLQFLDNGLHRTYEVPDVIDYEPHDGNILKMILGSISQYWDDADGAHARGREEDWLDG